MLLEWRVLIKASGFVGDCSVRVDGFEIPQARVIASDVFSVLSVLQCTLLQELSKMAFSGLGFLFHVPPKRSAACF